MDVKRRLYEELSPLYSKTKNPSGVFKKINTIGQDILRHLMQPASGRFSALIQGKPGSGKTRCTLGIVQILSSGHKTARPPIILLTYNIDIFMEELRINFEHGLINEYESLYRQMLKRSMDDKQDEEDEDDISIGLSYYTMHGYKSFESMIFNGTLEEKEITFSVKHASWDASFDKMVEDGKMTINEDLVKQLEGCIIIADEIHEVHARGRLNRGGLAISYLMQKLKNISLIISDATPLSRLSIEVVSIANIMLGTRYKIDDLFKIKDNVIKPNKKCFEVMDKIGSNTYMLEQPDIATCPSVIIEGEKIKTSGLAKCMNYVKCELTKFQADMIDKHFFGHQIRKIAETAIMWDGAILDGKNVNSNILRKIYPDLETCLKYSPKISGLHDLLFGKKMLYMPGITCVFTSLVIAPGTRLIKHYLKLAGIIDYDESATHSKLCLTCQGPHNNDDHVKIPIRFGTLNKAMTQVRFMETFKTFNNKKNTNGDLIKIIIVTNCVGVGISLRETQRFIMYDDSHSVPAEIQFRGRFVRPRSIRNALGENIVRCFQLITTHGQRETSSIKYAKHVHSIWMATKPIVEYILNRAQIIEFADLSVAGTNFLDGPVIIKRKNYYNALEIMDYPEYKIDNSASKARLAKIKIKPHSDILLPSAELRITIAGVLVKTLLMAMSTVTVKQIMNIIKNYEPLLNYNVSNLTEEDLYIYGHITDEMGKKMSMPILDEIVTDSQNLDDFEQLMTLLVKSPTSPWSVNSKNKLIKICFVNDMFYYAGDDDINLEPRFREFISYNELFLPINISVRMREYNREEHLEQIFMTTNEMREDEPIINIFTRIPRVILNTFLMMILLGNKFDGNPKIRHFIKILEGMMMIITKKRAESIMSKSMNSEYPLVYFNKSYHMIINGNLADVDIRDSILNRTEADVKLQIVSDRDIMRILLYNNAERGEEKKGKKRIQRGIDIYNNNIPVIINRLQMKRSKLGDELANMSGEFTNQLKYKETIVKNICELQMKNPDISYLEFMWQ